MPSRPGVEARRAMSIVVESIKGGYAYLGTILLLSAVSFLWFLGGAFLVSLLLASPVVAAGVGLVITAPALAASYYVVNRIFEGEEVGFRDFRDGLSGFWRKGLAIALVHTGFVVVLAADIVFFIMSKNSMVRLISVPLGYCILFVLLMANYYFPLLVLQDAGLAKTLKRAALLVLDNPVFSLLVALAWLLILLLCLVLTPALMLVFVGLSGFLQVNATRELFKKYGLIAVEETGSPKNGEGGS